MAIHIQYLSTDIVSSCASDNLQVCSAVLTQGVDPNAKDNLGMTGLNMEHIVFEHMH